MRRSMKKYYLLYLSLAILLAQELFAEPIDFTQATLVRRIRRSMEYPIDLYRSTLAGAHQNKVFTARTMFRLSAVIDEYQQKILRNETCASFFIYEANDAINTLLMPASMGIYKLGE